MERNHPTVVQRFPKEERGDWKKGVVRKASKEESNRRQTRSTREREASSQMQGGKWRGLNWRHLSLKACRTRSQSSFLRYSERDAAESVRQPTRSRNSQVQDACSDVDSMKGAKKGIGDGHTISDSLAAPLTRVSTPYSCRLHINR